jgi:hypothetical protein
MRDQLDVAGVAGLVESVDGAAALVVTLCDGGAAVSDVLTLGVGVAVGQSMPVGLGDVALADGVTLVLVVPDGVTLVLVVPDGVTLVLVVSDGVGHGDAVAVDDFGVGVDDFGVGVDDFGVGFFGGMPRGGPGLAGGTITCGGAGLGSAGTTGTVRPGTPLA